MSMYAKLLNSALGTAGRPGPASTTEELVDELARCRARLPSGPSPATASGGVPAAVADQLAYDMALVELCRRVGLAYDVGAFDRPEEARARLEQALAGRGLWPPEDRNGVAPA
jgi:hypothetical protein